MLIGVFSEHFEASWRIVVSSNLYMIVGELCAVQVYKYCKVAPDCNKGKENFIQATCDVQFNYNNQQHRECITEPTPTTRDPECTKFKEIQGIDSFNTYMDDRKKPINEVIILGPENRRITACYRENAGK